MEKKLTRKDFLRVGGALGAAGAFGGVLGETALAQAGGTSERPPNIVMILSDDQDDVDSLGVMPNVRRLLQDQGVRFTNSCTSFPLCSPSRAALLSGQYGHNNGVLNNNATNRFHEDEALPVWLQRAGYETAHIGKYLNSYNRADPLRTPPGWTEWYGSVDPSTYKMWGYTLNENGALKTYGQADVEDPDLYQTDVFAGKAVDYIGRKAAGEKPFFLSFAPLAPHREIVANRELLAERNPRPAPRHRGTFEGAEVPRPPSFDEEDVTDKPAFVRREPRLDEATIAQINRDYRSRLESLLSLDEAVGEIVGALEREGVLENTLIIYAGDNGWMHGQHRIPERKQVVYEESIRVPFIMRGPGIPRGERRKQLIVNADWAPTILDAAGAEAGVTVDGTSLLPFARTGRRKPREILLQTGARIDESAGTTDPYAGVRTEDMKYVEYTTGDFELYDLKFDPYELNSLHDDPDYAEVRQYLAGRLEELRDCSGDSCRTSLNSGTKRTGSNGTQALQDRLGPARRNATVTTPESVGS